MIYPLVKSYVLCSTHVTQLIWLLIICPLLIIEHSSYTIFTVYNYIHLCFSLSTYVKPVCYIVYFTIYILYLGRAMALWKNLKVVIPNNVVNNLISYKFNPVITLIVLSTYDMRVHFIWFHPSIFKRSSMIRNELNKM